ERQLTTRGGRDDRRELRVDRNNELCAGLFLLDVQCAVTLMLRPQANNIAADGMAGHQAHNMLAPQQHHTLVAVFAADELGTGSASPPRVRPKHRAASVSVATWLRAALPAGTRQSTDRRAVTAPVALPHWPAANPPPWS